MGTRVSRMQREPVIDPRGGGEGIMNKTAGPKREVLGTEGMNFAIRTVCININF